MSEYRRADMLQTWESKRWEPGLADGGYTYFGRFFNRLLESRGLNQSTFAAECRRCGFKLRGKSGKQRDIGQRSISDWMRGYAPCPREIPIYADAIMDFDDEEWGWFGVAYAYGQAVPKEDFEDLMEFRKFYRARLSEESLAGREDRLKKG